MDVTLYPLGNMDGYIVSIANHGWLHCIHKCKFDRAWSHRWPWLSSANPQTKMNNYDLKGFVRRKGLGRDSGEAGESGQRVCV